ncbi:MAG: ATP-binding protein [Bacteroidia bacterium]
MELHLYRIIQELLHNVVKHAKGATKATLYLTQHQHSLSILLEDNGAGFDSNTSHNGMGLTNVTNRMQLLKGSLSIDSQPQQGTTINLSIPVSG